MFRLMTTALAAATLLAACERPANRASTREVIVYEVRGVVQKVNAEQGRAVIAHEAIPGYMDAMSMEFTAKDSSDLATTQPGDVLEFRLSVTDERSWIDGLRKVGTAAVSVVAKETTGPEPGTQIPDAALIDQEGRPFRLSDFKGRTLALTFIFTRCPLPDFCPRISHNLAEVQREMNATNPQGGWHLISITIDPRYDTPFRLGEYAARYQADLTRWTFATGEPNQIAQFASTFGLEIRGEGGTFDHNLRTIAVDARGHVQKVFSGNSWKPSELSAEIRRLIESSR